jgi:hypothetical protein
VRSRVWIGTGIGLKNDHRRFKWPLVVIIGQALVLALSWGFFAVVRARGQITLDAISGETLQHYPRTTTYAFTLVATGLATFSS